MTFMLTGWMLYAMWVVLGLMGLNFLLGLFSSLKAGEFPTSSIMSYLSDLLQYILPLFMLANMMSLDPTGWLLLIAYYVGALGMMVKYLSDMKNKM